MEFGLRTSTDEEPATHVQVGSVGHWRKGSTGFAEYNPSAGRPSLIFEWLVTDWKNEALDRHPFKLIAKSYRGQ